MFGDNRISITLSEEVTQQVQSAINVLNTNLQQFLVKVSAQERREMAKMGDKTVAFVQKATEYAEKNPVLVPPYVDVPEMRKDVDAVVILRGITAELEKLTDQLNDTMMLAGSEAYTSSLAFYNSVKNAAKLNQPNAELIMNELKQRFIRFTPVSQPTEAVVA